MLIATTNEDKLKEIVAIVDGTIEFTTLNDFPSIPPPEETGSTFSENARQKALYYARACGHVTMAEDSGFEVAELDGAPGIYSARYLRPDATYPERFDAIYAALHARGKSRSAARYVCALAVASGADIVFETVGTVDGELSSSPAGSSGFGYDPIFYYPAFGMSFGEVSATAKHAVSHRGRALAQARALLRRWAS